MTGIVMDIKDGKAVVLCNDGRMIETANRGYQIGQRIKIKSRPQFKYMAVAACFLLFCIAGFTGHHIYNTAESYIYLDINPSIRLDINRFDKIISVVPLNEDAEVLLKAHPVETDDIDECIGYIVDVCKEDRYINEDNNDVEIEIMTSHDNVKSRANMASDRIKRENLIVDVSDVDEEQNERAMKHRVSAKRLAAYDEYVEAYGGDVDTAAEKLRSVPTKEIYRSIQDCEDNAQENAVIEERDEIVKPVIETPKLAQNRAEKSEKNQGGHENKNNDEHKNEAAKEWKENNGNHKGNAHEIENEAQINYTEHEDVSEAEVIIEDNSSAHEDAAIEPSEEKIREPHNNGHNEQKPDKHIEKDNESDNQKHNNGKNDSDKQSNKKEKKQKKDK